MTDASQVRQAIKEVTDAHWGANSTPLLLSNMPPILESRAPGYKQALGESSLKKFIKEAGPLGGFKLVEHPTQRPKVGVIPLDASYQFPSDEGRRQAFEGSSTANHEEALLAFLRVLSRLPQAELDKVVIPVSVLVRLLK